MRLKDLLSEKRSRLIKKWRDLLMETYPEDTRRFLKKEKDPFANPVGHVISKDVEIVYDELVEGELSERMVSSLDNILRIRAVQDLQPSQALAFVIQLKALIREELEGRTPLNGESGELQALDRRIDDMALLAFDVYSRCRQKIYEIRVNEIKNQYSRLLKRADILYEIPEKEPDL
jgi:hypothetical protein